MTDEEKLRQSPIRDFKDPYNKDKQIDKLSVEVSKLQYELARSRGDAPPPPHKITQFKRNQANLYIPCITRKNKAESWFKGGAVQARRGGTGGAGGGDGGAYMHPIVQRLSRGSSKAARKSAEPSALLVRYCPEPTFLMMTFASDACEAVSMAS